MAISFIKRGRFYQADIIGRNGPNSKTNKTFMRHCIPPSPAGYSLSFYMRKCRLASWGTMPTQNFE